MNEKSLIPSLRFVGFTDAWERRKLGEIVFPYTDIVNTPVGGYVRLGIKSHAKGTFHSYVPAGMEIGIAQMYRVAADKFIVNITFAWEHAVAITSSKDAGKLVSHRFPQFSFYDGMFPLFFRYSILDERFRQHLSLASPGGAGRNRVLKIAEMLEYKFSVTSEEEQQKIACFMERLDTLITLHRRKHEKLLHIKKSMLEKMFPKNGELFPEVRFAGFTAAWERRRLGETFTFLQNNTLSRADLSDSGDGAKNIHYGDILVKFGECTNIAKESLPIIMNGSVINKYRSSFLKNGDIVIADTAEDETVGKCTEIIEEKGEKIISGLHTIPCRPTCAFAGGFLGYYMNSPAFHDQFIPLMQGIKVTSISKGALQTTIVQYPHEKTEQAQIGRMFQQLDHLITLHQRKLERLQNIKKACLEKMFV